MTILRKHTRAMSASKNFTAAQLAALSRPLESSEAVPDDACTWHTSREGTSGILTCDIDDQTVCSFGGPVWHASVCPPDRRYAESLLGGVGEGVLFDQPGIHPDVHHLRRRMTLREIERLGCCKINER